MSTPLKWYEWLTLSPDEIRARGYEPSERYSRTGHRRALSKKWARTVGYWCLEEPRELMQRAGLNYKEPRHRMAYNRFRQRWGINSRRQVAEHLLEADIDLRYALAESTFAAVAECIDGEPPYMKTHEPGEAFRLVAPDMGILPIEASLYYLGLTEVCVFHGIDDASDYFDLENRRRYWHEASVFPWLPDTVAATYAREDVEAEDT